MEFYLWGAILFLGILLIWLFLKIWLLKKSAREIEMQFSARLKENTNVLIDISCRDKYMRKLADQINLQLKELEQLSHNNNIHHLNDFE